MRKSGHWIDGDDGISYRDAPDENAAAAKRARSIRVPDRLLPPLRRWWNGDHDPAKATRDLRGFRGDGGGTKTAFARLAKHVLADEEDEIVRHSPRHIAATWLPQDDQDPHTVADFLGVRTDTPISVHGQHQPDC